MIVIVFAFLFSVNTSITEQVKFSRNNTDSMPSKNIIKKKSISDEKIYCCTYCRTKYDIIRQGSSITIISIYNEHTNTIHGTVRNGKIYSDDPNEKSFKQTGKLYSLTGNTFRVKNPENGDYDDSILCK